MFISDINLREQCRYTIISDRVRKSGNSQECQILSGVYINECLKNTLIDQSISAKSVNLCDGLLSEIAYSGSEIKDGYRSQLRLYDECVLQYVSLSASKD